MTWIKRLEYLDKNKHLAGWFLAVLFCYAWLTKKPEPLTNAPALVVNQAQAVTQTAKASVRVKVVYRDVPGEAPRSLPCPDLEIQADSGSEGQHWQSQSVSQTPVLGPTSRSKWGIDLGVGITGILTDTAYLGASYNVPLGSYDLGLDVRGYAPQPWLDGQKYRQPGSSIGVTIRR